MWHSASRLFAIAIFVICATPLAEAQRSDQQVIILSAVADRANERLTIRGVNFGATAPSVFAEEQQMTVLSANDSEIVMMLPSAIPDGTYRLTLARGKGAVDRDTFHVAIHSPSQGPAGPTGATGASGPTGAPGPAGSDGAAGPQGPAGPAGATGGQGPAGPAGSQGPGGPAGAPGPMGPMGPQGPAGPAGTGGAGAGLAGIEVMFSLNPNPPSTIQSFNSLVGYATCPTGKRAIGGGFESLGGAAQMIPVQSLPFSDTTWRVQLRNTLAGPLTNSQVRVYVICAPAE